jgi:hypothetical protein
MRISCLVPALVLGVALVTSQGAGAADALDKAAIDKLVEQLGSDTFADRETAAKALDAIGEPALEALRAAAKSSEPEVRKRAAHLAASIETRTENTNHLKPKMVHIVCKDAPVSEAIAQLNKQTGYNVIVNDPANKLKDTKITLDTGKVTFWKAVELVCEKAGLDEVNPALGRVPGAPGVVPGGPATVPPGRIRGPLPPVPAPAPGVLPAAPAVVPPGALALAPVAPRIAQKKLMIARPIGAPNQVVLYPSERKGVEPSDTSSAVCVKAITDARVAPSTDKQIGIALLLSPEPKLQMQRIVSVRLEKALDDQGQDLKVAMDSDTGGVALPGGGVILPGGRMRPYYPFGGAQMHRLQLERGAKPSKEIKELRGTATVDVLSESKPMILVEDILKAADKEVKGKEGGRIKVIAVEKNDAQTAIRFEFEQPDGVIPDNVSMPVVMPLPNPPVGVPVPLPAPVPAPRPLPPVPAPKPLPPVKAPGAAEKADKVNPAGKAAEAPPAPPAGGGAAGGVAVAVVAQPMIARAFWTPGITLRDAKDNILPVQVEQNFRNAAGKATMEYKFIYATPDKDKAAVPAKLVFSGRKSVSLNIPFTITGITLP